MGFIVRGLIVSIRCPVKPWQKRSLSSSGRESERAERRSAWHRTSLRSSPIWIAHMSVVSSAASRTSHSVCCADFALPFNVTLQH
jgi:hypothetical protein